MKRMLTSLVVILVLSVLVMPSYAAAAPQQDNREVLRIDDVIYETEQLQFVVQMSCKWGMANAGEHSDFRVKTILYIDWSSLGPLEGERDVLKVEGEIKGQDGYVKIEPTYLYGNPHLSWCMVHVYSELINPGGKVMGKTATFSKFVYTGLPGGV